MTRLLMFLVLTALTTPALATVDVVTTLPEYAALARDIGGNDVRVISLTKSSQDPHFIDAKPSYIVALNHADLFILNGLELEIGWIPSLLTQARNPRIRPGAFGHLNASQFAGKILDKPAGTIDRSMGDIHAGGNPHFSRDPARMSLVIKEITNRLCRLAPASSERFKANSKTLQDQLSKLLKATKEKWSKLPAQARQAIEYHKSWLYLFDTLEITVPIRIEPKPGVAPSPAHLAKVVNVVKSNNIKILLQETSYPSKLMSTIARITKAQRIVVSSGPDLDRNQDYMSYITALMDTLYKAVTSGSAP
ncbi:MAG: zinc ABC transporter substrate-binding protein [Deltaproteobacteria bacterium]|nr:zinc ABC transporter substrate-binding protein [Deltaproteobacteria bacterium]